MPVYELLESRVLKNINIGEYLHVLYEKSSKRDIQCEGCFVREGKATIEESLKVIKEYDNSGSLQVVSYFKIGEMYSSIDEAIISINQEFNIY